MKSLIVGLWAILVTLGAGYAVSSMNIGGSTEVSAEDGPQFETLEYTSLPTLSVPVIHQGGVAGYVVVRIVYTADEAVLQAVASTPDPFLTDEIFRSLYGSAEIEAGRLQPLNLEELAGEVRDRVNERMGDAVVRDLLVHGINYISASDMPAGPAAARQPVQSAAATTAVTR